MSYWIKWCQNFSSPRDFEFTSECLVFDLLNIGLYHGWLVDPQDVSAATALGPLSYNQLVEKIIKSTESSATEEMASEGKENRTSMISL